MPPRTPSRALLVADSLVISRIVTHSFIVILALAAALASSVSVVATSRSSLGGRGFVAQWGGQRGWGALPTDTTGTNLRTPPLARTSSAPANTEPTPQEPSGTLFSAMTANPEEPAPAPAKRREVQEYEVASGDTLLMIAGRFGVSVETLLWANKLKESSLLRPGDTLKVPPVDGVLHEVASGESLMALAQRYKVDVDDITGFTENDLADPHSLSVGKLLMIPGGTKPPDPPPPVMQAAVRAPQAQPEPQAAASAPAPAPTPAPAPAQRPPSQGFVWPTYGPIFTYFGGYHAGLDISPPHGTPVVATAAGVVSAVNRWNYSYGYHILVDHGGGVRTMYAHLSEMLVGVGDNVAQGQLIGRVGSTGRSTGPHLHFEIHRSGAPVDPLGVLPR